MAIQYFRIGITSLFVIFSSGLAQAATEGIVWDEPTPVISAEKADKLKTSHLNEISLKKTKPEVTNSALMSASEDEMMISDVPAATKSVDTPVNRSPVMKPAEAPIPAPAVSPAEMPSEASTKLPAIAEKTSPPSPIIWDEALPELTPPVAAAPVTDEMNPVENTQISGNQVQPPLEKFHKGSAMGPATQPGASKEAVLPPQSALQPVPVPPPARQEIASITGSSENMASIPAPKASADNDMTTSLLTKIRLLETEKESLRKKLMQVDPGKLKDVYQCSVEHNQINNLQARLDVLLNENKTLKNNANNTVSIPKLPASEL